jgi:hypothetical protein
MLLCIPAYSLTICLFKETMMLHLNFQSILWGVDSVKLYNGTLSSPMTLAAWSIDDQFVRGTPSCVVQLMNAVSDDKSRYVGCGVRSSDKESGIYNAHVYILA